MSVVEKMSGRARRGQPLMGNLLNRPSQRHVHFSIHGNSQWPQFWDNALYLSISFSLYVAQTQSLFGACCLRMLLRLRHYLDRVHSDLNNMLFVQYVDRGSRYNMWSRVKALLSHMSRDMLPVRSDQPPRVCLPNAGLKPNDFHSPRLKTDSL